MKVLSTHQNGNGFPHSVFGVSDADCEGFLHSPDSDLLQGVDSARAALAHRKDEGRPVTASQARLTTEHAAIRHGIRDRNRSKGNQDSHPLENANLSLPLTLLCHYVATNNKLLKGPGLIRK